VLYHDYSTNAPTFNLFLHVICLIVVAIYAKINCAFLSRFRLNLTWLILFFFKPPKRIPKMVNFTCIYPTHLFFKLVPPSSLSSTWARICFNYKTPCSLNSHSFDNDIYTFVSPISIPNLSLSEYKLEQCCKHEEKKKHEALLTHISVMAKAISFWYHMSLFWRMPPT